ncbi:hypothetical protein O181_025061 [Austropuccinia psidii MF-1]|uniref:Uncharacterized protein n=1 Tax=Austropuccinia psidii MF-1 TaxID=1389203 RepID=A0A9Q3CMN5_9BASI|nr:hypothetical protein [Austropuccinia psidii MF-1]
MKLLVGWGNLSFKEKVKKIKNWLKSQSFLSIDQKQKLEMTLDLEKEGAVASKSSKLAPEQSKDKPKQPHKKKKGPRNNKGEGNWHRPYPN